MHIKQKNSWIKHFDFIILNLIALLLAFTLAYYIKFDDFGFLYIGEWKVVIMVMVFIDIVLTLMTNPYSGIFRRPYYEDALKLAGFTIYSFVLVSIIFYVLKVGAVYSRVTIGLTFLFYYFIAFIFLYIRKKMLLSGKVKGFINRKRSLFVVTSFEGVDETMINILANDMEEYDIQAFCFTDGNYSGDSYENIPVLSLEKAVDYVVTEHIDDVFIAADPSLLSRDSYRRLIDNEVAIHLNIESLIGTEGDDQYISRVGVYKTASIGPYAFDGKRMAYLTLKRGCDIVIGLIGCILLIPISLLVKLAFLITGDTAPIFYYQTRVGRYGETFKMYKFRSMVPNADEMLKELLKQEEYRKQWEANQKFDDDPRITKVGRFMRKTSLDEVPQFLNMLKGDMSLVGPRPLVVGELADHDGLSLYNRVKPGITGWWACNGRSNINYRERLELEYYYVKNCSLSLDLLCIVRTVVAVLKRDGAS